MQTVLKKNKTCSDGEVLSSTFWKKINQSEMLLLYVSHCQKFNAGIKDFEFLIPIYAIRVKFPIENFSGKNQSSTCSYREISIQISSANIFKKRFGIFAQTGFWRVKYKTSVFMLDLLHNFEVSDAEFFWKINR